MVQAPTPEEEDRRRLCRERKVLINERVEHVNRIKGLLFAQGVSGYEPLHRDRRRRLDELRGRAMGVLAEASEGPDQPRARSARIAARADQGCGSRAGRAACAQRIARAVAGGDVARS